jgi:hypothetical protein
MSTEQNLTSRVRAFDGVADALVQSQWAEKKWVWVADKEEGYINGYITKEDGDNVDLNLSNDTVSSKALLTVHPEMHG